MRSGIVVVTVCLLISTALAVFLSLRYKNDLAATQDVVTALIYFMESHDGRFPASPEEFLESSFIERSSDGAFRVNPLANTRFRRETHGIPIRDLAPFQIGWGADVDNIVIDERGLARFADEREARLVSWPSSGSSWKTYAIVLYGVNREIRSAAQTSSQPSAPQ